jgi:amino-acid N-acetyltransferase
MSEIVTRLALATDLQDISRLLAMYDLPTADVHEHLPHFIVAINGQGLVGCIGLEIHGEHGLLRSLAVDERFRNQGIARKLYRRLLAVAADNGIRQTHLLTTTAEEYFRRLGFNTMDRTSAPAGIKESQQFRTLCSSEAVYMTKSMNSSVLYFESGAHQIRSDASGSKYWVVKSENMMFTRFEVPPHTTFPSHAHDSEQMTYVLDGKLWFEVDDEAFVLKAGDFISIPSRKLHRVTQDDHERHPQ